MVRRAVDAGDDVLDQILGDADVGVRVAQAARADASGVAADRSREQRAQVIGAHAVLLAEADDQARLVAVGGRRGLLAAVVLLRGALVVLLGLLRLAIVLGGAVVLGVTIVLLVATTAAIAVTATPLLAIVARRLGLFRLGSANRLGGGRSRRLVLGPRLPELLRLFRRSGGALVALLALVGAVGRGARGLVEVRRRRRALVHLGRRGFHRFGRGGFDARAVLARAVVAVTPAIVTRMALLARTTITTLFTRTTVTALFARATVTTLFAMAALLAGLARPSRRAW